ncbi:MAG: hypothetical protein AAF756_02300 [Pseudomonadota bacterium]
MVKLNDVSDEQYRKTAEHQKASAIEVAAKIESGEELNAMERKLAAALVRRAGRAISSTRKRPAGKQKKLPDTLPLQAAMLIVHKEMSATAAAHALADKHGCTVQSVQQALGLTRKHGWQVRRRDLDEAIALLEFI